MEKIFLIFICFTFTLIGKSQNQNVTITLKNLSELHTNSELLDNNLKDSVLIAKDSLPMFGSYITISFNTFDYWPLSRLNNVSVVFEGRTLYHSTYRNDSLIETNYYQNGNKQLVSTHKYSGPECFDRLWVYTCQYYKNGQLYFETNPNDTGLRNMKQYYKNGELLRHWFLIDNKYSKIDEEWHENGQPKYKEYYLEYDGQNVSEFKETKVGVWQYWNKKGELIDEISQSKNEEH